MVIKLGIDCVAEQSRQRFCIQILKPNYIFISVGTEEKGCSAIFGYSQFFYSVTEFVYNVAKYLLPTWAILIVFQPVEDNNIMSDTATSTGQSIVRVHKELYLEVDATTKTTNVERSIIFCRMELQHQIVDRSGDFISIVECACLNPSWHPIISDLRIIYIHLPWRVHLARPIQIRLCRQDIR